MHSKMHGRGRRIESHEYARGSSSPLSSCQKGVDAFRHVPSRRSACSKGAVQATRRRGSRYKECAFFSCIESSNLSAILCTYVETILCKELGADACIRHQAGKFLMLIRLMLLKVSSCALWPFCQSTLPCIQLLQSPHLCIRTCRNSEQAFSQITMP